MTKPKHRLWIPKGDGTTLCLDGYPVEIRRHGPFGYSLWCEGVLMAPRKTPEKVGQGLELSTAKYTGVRYADELDEFEALEPDPEMPKVWTP